MRARLVAATPAHMQASSVRRCKYPAGGPRAPCTRCVINPLKTTTEYLGGHNVPSKTEDLISPANYPISREASKGNT
jgi:hypothetical protein